jgi:hypothetical protein
MLGSQIAPAHWIEAAFGFKEDPPGQLSISHIPFTTQQVVKSIMAQFGPAQEILAASGFKEDPV